MTASMRTRARKPASAVERDALAAWQQALPAQSMTALASSGYDESARAEFLRNVVGVSHSDAADFSAESYVIAADDEYDAGTRAGAAAGAAAYDASADTVSTSAPDRTPFTDGYSDGFTGGYWVRAAYVHATDIVGYTFCADNLCPACTVAAVTSDSRYDGWALAPGVRMSAEDNLSEIAAAFGIKRDDESSYDSGDFPKVIFASMAEDDETCGNCGEELI